tara:strand:+ start:138 stop:494 length:357 start_codon:yes stop_codon:yes gene_type:complete
LAAVGIPMYQGYISNSKIKKNEIQASFDQMNQKQYSFKGGELCPADVDKCGPYTTYTSDPCQNPYKGAHNRDLAAYFMKLRCASAPEGVTCNSPHSSRGESWEGKVLAPSSFGPLICR